MISACENEFHFFSGCQKSFHNLPGRYSTYKKDLEEIYERTASIDNILLAYLWEVAARRKYPPLVFRICRYILSLGKKYGLDGLAQLVPTPLKATFTNTMR